ANSARPRRRGDRMRRREFISLLGGAAAWPLAAHGQQPAMAVIGYLSGGAPAPLSKSRRFPGGAQGRRLYEGQKVEGEDSWAEGQYDRLPAMVSELLRRDVAVIATLGTPSALAAKTATTMIPIVFGVSEDPVKVGLVASIARPGGNATGVSYLLSELGAKQ